MACSASSLLFLHGMAWQGQPLDPGSLGDAQPAHGDPLTELSLWPQGSQPVGQEMHNTGMWHPVCCTQSGARARISASSASRRLRQSPGSAVSSPFCLDRGDFCLTHLWRSPRHPDGWTGDRRIFDWTRHPPGRSHEHCCHQLCAPHSAPSLFSCFSYPACPVPWTELCWGDALSTSTPSHAINPPGTRWLTRQPRTLLHVCVQSSVAVWSRYLDLICLPWLGHLNFALGQGIFYHTWAQPADIALREAAHQSSDDSGSSPSTEVPRYPKGLDSEEWGGAQ